MPMLIDPWQRLSDIVCQNTAANHHPFKQFHTLIIYRLLTENIVVLFLQYAGLSLTTLTFHTSPIWFASGTAYAFVFLRGLSILPGIWLGSFLAYYMAQSGTIIAGGSATLFSIQAFFLLWFSYHYIGPSLVFHRVMPFFYFVISSSFLTAMSSLFLIMLYATTLSQPIHSVLILLWLKWWLANLNGALLFSCVLFTWDLYFPDISALKKINKIIFCFYYGTLLTLTLMLVSSQNAIIILLLAASTFICIMIISIHYAWCGSVFAIFLLGFILGIGNYAEAPVFLTRLSSIDLFLSLFLLLTIIIGLWMGSFNRKLTVKMLTLLSQ